MNSAESAAEWDGKEASNCINYFINDPRKAMGNMETENIHHIGLHSMSLFSSA